MSEIKNVGLATVMSIIVPGLGQTYNGEIAKGIMFYIILLVLLLSVSILIGFVLCSLFWVYNIYDAFTTANRINKVGC